MWLVFVSYCSVGLGHYGVGLVCVLEICMLVLNAKYVCWLFVFYGPFAHLSMSYSDFILIFEIQLVDWSGTTIDDISYTTTSPS